MKGFVSIGILCAALAALAGCGGGTNGPPPGALQRLGPLEGRLNLVVLPGYAQRGGARPALDWITPFERKTGCEVSSTTVSSPERVLALMGTSRYDGVTASGDVGGGLVARGLVNPVNTELLPSYDLVFPSLRRQPANTVDGVVYGVPIGRTAELLTWRPDQVRTNPNKPVSTKLIFEPAVASRYSGRVTMQDNPMSIASAALYLRKHEQDLDIDDVYELDEEQFDAVIELLARQRPYVGVYWRGDRQNLRAFTERDAAVGLASQVTINRLLKQHPGVRAAGPKEETTGRSDTWMISTRAKHPNCMYRWMNYVTGAAANAKIAEQTRQAPANAHACDLMRKRSFCDVFMAANEELFDQVHYWTTPLRNCGDGRGDVCKTYADWARAWTEVTRGE
jgi:putative spermidine/putrescine transport system substrate-binding protein